MAGWSEPLWRLLPAVRRPERSRTLFFTSLLLLVTAAQTVGLAGSEALFLAALSAQHLPGAFVVASVVTVLGSLLYAAWVGRARNDQLFAQMLLGAGVALGAVPLLVSVPSAAVLYALVAAFYLTQSIFTNHFWTFSGDYFDTLASKRLFPVFTVGASVGGLLGGLVGAATARFAGPLATLFVWGALLVAASALLFAARRPLRRWGPLTLEEADETSMEGVRGAVSYLRGSRFGRWLVVSAIGMVLALFIAQYIYSDLFVRAYPDPADLAVFLSIYLAVTNAVEIVIELWITPLAIRRFGVASSHVAHPVLLLGSFGALFVSPVLATAIAARVNRELVENALAQPVRTLVFNALPPRFRGRIRAFLEGIVVYAGMSVAGIALVLIETPDLRLLALAGGVAAAIYLAANLGARRAYLRTLIDGIRSGRLELADVETDIGAWEAARLADLCTELLRSDTQRPSRALLELIPSLGARGLVAPLIQGLDHPLASVRRHCAEAMAGSDEAVPALEGAISDPAPEVRLAALRAFAHDPKRASGAARPLLDDRDPTVRAAAAALQPDPEAALAPLLADEDPSVRSAALARCDGRFATALLDAAGAASPAVRQAALESLARSLPETLPEAQLEDALGADEPAVRAAALGVAGRRDAPQSLSTVARFLADPVGEVREAATRALSARGADGAAAAFGFLGSADESTATAAFDAIAGSEHPEKRKRVAAELRRRVELGWQAIVGSRTLHGAQELADRFLQLAAGDALMRHRRLAFRALEALESPRVIRNVEQALRFGSSRARGDALEVLSNLGDREASRMLVLMHEQGDLEDRLASLGGAVALPSDRAAFLELARASGDRWYRLSTGHAGVGEDAGGGSGSMERLLALKRVPLFENLSLDQLDAINQLAVERTFVAGECIVREGDAGGELYLLLEGSADAWLGHDTPEAQRLSTMEAGSYFGEMAILDNEPRSASVVVREPARALALDGPSLKTLVMQMPEIAFELLRVMSARVRTSERRLRER
ncbi:MAG: HEAT repeat domain-containing protein [Myxococcota bacterium]